MLQIDVNLLDRIAAVSRKHPELAADIIQGLKFNQLTSKLQVMDELPRDPETRVIVLGGWYGIGFMALAKTRPLHYTMIDIDPNCEIVGELMLHPRFQFITADACMINTDHFDVIVNCSSEHMDRDDLERSFTTIQQGKKYIIQNNNNFNVPDHTNCFPSIDKFVDYLSNHFAIESARITAMDNGTERYTVVCRKM